MKSEGEEIGHDEDSCGAARGEASYCFGEVRRPALEKRRLDELETALVRNISGYHAHGFIRRSDTRAVREDDDPSLQTLPCT